MNGEQPLPPICRFGKTALEKKLLLYLDAKAKYPAELRLPYSSGFGRSDIPPLEHPFEFVPMYEIETRVFMFKTKLDRDRARKALSGIDKTKRQKKPRRRR